MRPTLRHRPALFLCAAVLALAGCTQQDSECLGRIGRSLVERARGAAGALGERVGTDLKAVPLVAGKEPGLKEKIEARMRWDALLSEVKIEVQVNGSEVELKGTVKNEAQRRRAGDLAESTAGVQAVNDSLKVEE